MITITFYSYKGGVGRSLALANIASRLSEFNKKVCLIDFDLEAPGLQYKFAYNQSSIINKGLVDYIFSYANEGKLPKDILQYTIQVGAMEESAPIFLMPAGKTDSKDYWRRLSMINWFQLLYENENGLAFFLDLKEKIKKSLNPDFLLIDSRTGISEMSGITLSLMADEVVIVAANNKENIKGAKKVISSITNPDNLLLDKMPKVTLVLSRIPFTEKPFDKMKEQYLVNKIKAEFAEIYDDDVVIVHSDRELEEDEKLKINSENEDGVSPVSKDYLKLFGKIIEKHLTPEEIEKFNKIKVAERLYRLAINKENIKDQLNYVSDAIELTPSNIEYYIFRANLNMTLKEYNKVIIDCLKVLEIDKNNNSAISLLGDVYFEMGEIDKSFEYFERLLEINSKSHYAYFKLALLYDKQGEKVKEIDAYKKALELNPNDSSVYNNLATHFREEGDLKSAFAYVYKALEIDPSSSHAFTSLAEIYADLNNLDEFYLNLELAFINAESDHEDIEEVIKTVDTYKKFYRDERFKRLLEKYNFNISDVTD